MGFNEDCLQFSILKLSIGITILLRGIRRDSVEMPKCLRNANKSMSHLALPQLLTLQILLGPKVPTPLGSSMFPPNKYPRPAGLQRVGCSGVGLEVPTRFGSSV